MGTESHKGFTKLFELFIFSQKHTVTLYDSLYNYLEIRLVEGI